MAQTPSPPLTETDGPTTQAPITQSGSRIPSLIRSSHKDQQAIPGCGATRSPSTPKTQLQDKPLPARPAASLVNMPSPSKDSRGLIDACEKPLKAAWPTLTPRSVSVPERKPVGPGDKFGLSSISNSKQGRSASTMTAGPGGRIESKLPTWSRRSGTSTLDEVVQNEGDLQSTARSRQVSVAQRNVQTANEDKPSILAFVSHSEPSQNSFEGTSDRQDIPRDVEEGAASRIPISGHRQTTLVDDTDSTGPKQHFSDSDVNPLSGTRRLKSPTSLNVLDTGFRCRQLRRCATNVSVTRTGALTSTTRVDGSRSSSLQTRSSSPGFTAGSSCSEDDEAITPAGYTRLSRQNSSIGHDGSFTIPEVRHEGSEAFWNTEESRLTRPPPSRSPYTGPLPTIPSRSTLPINLDCNSRQPPTESIISADLADLVPRYSTPKTPNRDRESPHHSSEFHGNRETDSSAMLSQQENTNPQALFQDTEAGRLAKRKAAHRSHTLSLLEGKGTPPTTDTSTERLRRFFGDDDIDRRTPEPGTQKERASTLIEKANAAQKYLDLGCASVSDGSNGQEQPHGYQPDTIHKPCITTAEGSSTQHGEDLAHLPQSKWSDSTPSTTENCQDEAEPAASSLLQASGVEDASTPTVVPSPDHARPATFWNESFNQHLMTPPAPSESQIPVARTNNPSRRQGSVRAAREGIAARYADQTLSSQSKRSPRNRNSTGIPSPIRPAQRSRRTLDRNPRVPSSSIAYSQTNRNEASVSAEPAQALPTARGRSKGRMVLHKINGLLSNRREKKTVVPPLLEKPLQLPVDNSDAAVAYSGDISVPGSAARPHPDAGHTIIQAESSAATANLQPTPDPTHKTNTEVQPTTDETDIGAAEAMILAGNLYARAAHEGDNIRRWRFTNFADTLARSVKHVRDAELNATAAQNCAEAAKRSAESAQRSADIAHTRAQAAARAAYTLQQYVAGICELELRGDGSRGRRARGG